MAVLEQTLEQRELDREEEIEDREWAASREDSREEGRRQHELQLAKVKAAIPQRHKTIVRIGLAVAKAPALVVLALTIPLLVLLKREIPESLSNFMNL